MIKGLKTGNAALVAAAAEEMHANAADVGGNNVSIDGTPTIPTVSRQRRFWELRPQTRSTRSGSAHGSRHEFIDYRGTPWRTWPDARFQLHPHHHGDHPHFGHMWG